MTFKKLKTFSEQKCIDYVLSVFNATDFDAKDSHKLSITLTITKMVLQENKDWTSLAEVHTTLRAVLASW